MGAPRTNQQSLSALDRRRITEQWWHERGYFSVRVWIEEERLGERGGTIHVLRSNLVNGLPPK